MAGKLVDGHYRIFNSLVSVKAVKSVRLKLGMPGFVPAPMMYLPLIGRFRPGSADSIESGLVEAWNAFTPDEKTVAGR